MTSPVRSTSRARAFAATAAASALLHAGGLAAASQLGSRGGAPPPPTVVEFEAAPPPEAPPPPAAAPAARNLPHPAEPALPPPPSETPPPEAPQERPIPRVGVSLSSTATGGAFAVGVGNTLHGRASEIAADPAEVKPYAGPAGPGRLSAQPRAIDLPEIAYPPEARRAGVEGKVVLLLRIDALGRVVDARVVSEPGSGLGAAARAGAFLFRFSPGLLDGEPAVTEIRFTYTFVLE